MLVNSGINVRIPVEGTITVILRLYHPTLQCIQKHLDMGIPREVKGQSLLSYEAKSAAMVVSKGRKQRAFGGLDTLSSCSEVRDTKVFFIQLHNQRALHFSREDLLWQIRLMARRSA